MTIKRTLAATTAIAATTALGVGLAVAPASAKQGTAPLAGVLVDQNQFDKNGRDYDIVTEAVLAVLASKPQSPVSALTDGKVRLTAFVPQDRAFISLVTAVTGSKPASEQAAFETIAGAFSIDVIEQILEYHVVPGATITAKKAVKANGAKLGAPALANAETLARVRELRAAGLSMAVIAQTLTAEGRDTMRGGQWHACTVKKILDRVPT